MGAEHREQPPLASVHVFPVQPQAEQSPRVNFIITVTHARGSVNHVES